MFHQSGGLTNPFQQYKLFELKNVLSRLMPKNILELGTGSTSLVFAGHLSGDKEAVLLCVDESEKWLGNTEKLISSKYDSLRRIRFEHRPKKYDFSGRFKRIYYNGEFDTCYDFIYIDGPSLDIDGKKHKDAVNSNVLDILQTGCTPDWILIDARFATAAYLASFLEKTYRVTLSELAPEKFYLKIPYQYHSLFEYKGRKIRE